MKAAPSRAALLLALLVVTACDDGTGPDGKPSDFEVQTYVEIDGTAGMSAGDLPLEATITVTSNADGSVLTAESGPDGIATFASLPAGSYTVTHAITGGTDGIDLQGNATQTVVAPFAGDQVVLTRFIYRFEPGTLAGVVFRDENGTTFYEEGQDSVYRDVVLVLFAGEDTLGAPAATDTTDDAGMYDFGERAVGEYRIIVREPAGTVVLGANPREVSVEPGAATFHPIEMIGDPTGVVITIAAARDSAVGDTVKVRGVVTAGQGTYRDDAVYVQDATSGIFVFGIDAGLGLAPGDSVQVLGVRTNSREEATLSAVSVVELGTGVVPSPATITTAQLNAGDFQGQLATLSATVDSITAGAGGFEVWVHDASGNAVVFVDDDTGIEQSAFVVNDPYTITGVLGTYDADDDNVIELGDYRLMPRETSDVAEL